jgi:DNA-binding CsgD family transcriptional regulator
MKRSVARFLDGVLEDAHGAADLRAFRTGALERVAALVGLDTGSLLAPPPILDGGDDDAASAACHAFDAKTFEHYLANRRRYWRADMQPVAKAFAANGGFVIDGEVFDSSEKRARAIYREAMIPAGISSVLAAVISFRGAVSGMLCLNRHARGRFQARDLSRLRDVTPVLGMVDAAVAARARGSTLPTHSLTAREREVSLLVRAGLRNKEIAAVLGRSSDTVRKQTIRVYEKLRVSGRVELVAKLGGATQP